MARRKWRMSPRWAAQHPDLFEPHDTRIVAGTCAIPRLDPIPPPPDYSTPQAVTERIREASRAWGRRAATDYGEPLRDQRASSAWFHETMLPALSDKAWGRTYHAFREACQRPIPEDVDDAPVVKPVRKPRRRAVTVGA